MKHRKATEQELMAYLEREHGKTTVRHFTKEVARRNARNGVAHIQRTKCKVEIDATGCYCILDGKREKLTASVAYDEGVKPIVYDVRLDNPYLPN